MALHRQQNLRIENLTKETEGIFCPVQNQIHHLIRSQATNPASTYDRMGKVNGKDSRHTSQPHGLDQRCFTLFRHGLVLFLTLKSTTNL